MYFLSNVYSKLSSYSVLIKHTQKTRKNLAKRLLEWKNNTSTATKHRHGLPRGQTTVYSGAEKLAKNITQDKGLHHIVIDKYTTVIATEIEQ